MSQENHMKIMRTAALFALSALVTTGLFTQSAVANPPGTTQVSLADIDPSSAEGARIAKERVRQAARRVCAQVDDPLDLGRAEHFVACVDATTNSTMQQLSAKTLVARSN
jgi:UrcA family protein